MKITLLLVQIVVMYKFNCEVLATQAKEHITYHVASEKVRSRFVLPNRSYRDAVAVGGDTDRNDRRAITTPAENVRIPVTINEREVQASQDVAPQSQGVVSNGEVTGNISKTTQVKVTQAVAQQNDKPSTSDETRENRLKTTTESQPNTKRTYPDHTKNDNNNNRVTYEKVSNTVNKKIRVEHKKSTDTTKQHEVHKDKTTETVKKQR